MMGTKFFNMLFSLNLSQTLRVIKKTGKEVVLVSQNCKLSTPTLLYVQALGDVARDHMSPFVDNF